MSAWTTLRVSLSRMALAVLGGLAVWPLVFAVLGFHVADISSGSMMPHIRVGDVVVASPMEFDAVRPGQIVTVHNPAKDDGSLLTHRVHAIDADGVLVTKGDANADVDSTPVPAGDVWLGRLRVPLVGYPGVWLDRGDWVPLVAVGTGLLLLARTASERPFRKVDGARSATLVAATAAGMVVVVLVLVPATGHTSSAAFTSSSATGASTWAVAAASLGRYGDAVLADKPFLFFRMDEQSGDVVVDSSGNDHPSTYRGSPTKAGVAGALPGQTAVSSATEFNGVAAIASDRVYAQTLDFAFEAFVKSRTWADNDGTSTLAELRTPTGFRDRVFLQYGSLYYQADESAAPVHLQWYLPADGTWHYLAVSMSGTSVTIRMDDSVWRGTVPGRTPVAAARFVVGTHLQPYGDPAAMGTESFKGVLDEIALYTHALTEAQMAAHAQASKG
jgi:signal peptidase I